MSEIGDALCPAPRLDREHEEQIVCYREPHVRGAFTFICSHCWKAMLDGKARREEWKV
jgi:hypothetical protein